MLVTAKIADMPGQRFGRLMVIREAPPHVRHTEKRRVVKRRFECKCDCGSLATKRMGELRSGRTRSCGCLHDEMSRLQARRHGDAGHTSKAPEYLAWINMVARCENPASTKFKDYGARGIVVCQRWRASYEAFLADMGRKPTPKHSIDRKDVNGNYEPGNCKWSTALEQRHNQRRSKKAAA